MAEGTHEIESNGGSISFTSADGNRDHLRTATTAAPPDVHDTASKLQRAMEDYAGGDDVMVMEKPSSVEVWIWYLYELCSYFLHSALLPIVFPLMISQIHGPPAEPDGGWTVSRRNVTCRSDEIKLYEALVYKSIDFGTSKISALQWTSFSWGLGLGLAGPILWIISASLDHGSLQTLIAGTAIATGFFFCLPTGFFNVTWIFPPFIIAIVAASTIAAVTHTRQHALMVRGFAGPNLNKPRFALRRWISGWLSLYAAAAGGLGSAVMIAFTYYMLRNSEKVLSLWIVTIFSGLKWATGISHVFFIKTGTIDDGGSTDPPSNTAHSVSIFAYPHAIGTLILTFLSSFTTMCIFGSAFLYFAGYICLNPPTILYSWLVYFIFPLISLPAIHLLQYVIRADSAKMHMLGFILSLMTSGFGFYYRAGIWQKGVVLAFAAVQGTSAGLLHAFQRVLLTDCSPPGKEGVFAAWFEWCRTAGTFVGFTVAAALPGEISTSLAVTFLTSVAGMVVLVYGHISDSGGATAAGHLAGGDDSSGRVDDSRYRDGDVSLTPPRRLALENTGGNSLAVMKDRNPSFHHEDDISLA
ncbi:hypothetical protein LINGRAHAP2_LOCUS26150 [Linum grandiflorum]